MATTFNLKRKLFVSAAAIDKLNYIVQNPHLSTPGEVDNARRILQNNGQNFLPAVQTATPKPALTPTPAPPKPTPAPPKPTPMYTQADMVNAARRGRDAGRNQVGMWGGIKNTYNKAGTMGKAGMWTAAAGATYLMGKGLGLWGKKKEEKTYSIKRKNV